VKIAIHQPHYLPWLGYLAKWAAADLFVFLDTVQYEKNGWQNRNRVKTPAGPRWLTVPVRASLGTPISEVEIDVDQPWARRHLRTIEASYARAPHFARFAGALREFYARPWGRLAPLATASARWLAEAVGISTPCCAASSLGVTAADATGRLVALCRAVGATVYLSGPDGVRYLDLGRFAEAGIAVRVQRYDHPVYVQAHGDFVPYLSALDLLLMHGNEALDILRKGDAWLEPSP
jgi:hypothetical protein